MEEKQKKERKDFSGAVNADKEKARKIRNALENRFAEIVKTLESEHNSLMLSELNVQINQPNKLLTFFDESKTFTKSIYLEEFLENIDNVEFFCQNAPRLIKEAAVNCRNKKVFEQMNFFPPLTLIVSDEKENVLLKFILIDSDRMYAEEKLLKDLDKELNTFIKNLLSDLD